MIGVPESAKKQKRSWFGWGRKKKAALEEPLPAEISHTAAMPTTPSAGAELEADEAGTTEVEPVEVEQEAVDERAVEVVEATQPTADSALSGVSEAVEDAVEKSAEEQPMPPPELTDTTFGRMIEEFSGAEGHLVEEHAHAAAPAEEELDFADVLGLDTLEHGEPVSNEAHAAPSVTAEEELQFDEVEAAGVEESPLEITEIFDEPPADHGRGEAGRSLQMSPLDEVLGAAAGEITPRRVTPPAPTRGQGLVSPKEISGRHGDVSVTPVKPVGLTGSPDLASGGHAVPVDDADVLEMLSGDAPAAGGGELGIDSELVSPGQDTAGEAAEDMLAGLEPEAKPPVGEVASPAPIPALPSAPVQKGAGPVAPPADFNYGNDQSSFLGGMTLRLPDLSRPANFGKVRVVFGDKAIPADVFSERSVMPAARTAREDEAAQTPAKVEKPIEVKATPVAPLHDHDHDHDLEPEPKADVDARIPQGWRVAWSLKPRTPHRIWKARWRAQDSVMDDVLGLGQPLESHYAPAAEPLPVEEHEHIGTIPEMEQEAAPFDPENAFGVVEQDVIGEAQLEETPRPSGQRRDGGA